MFIVKISRSIVIQGCPDNGIAAIDFRRANGLPDAPTSCHTLALSFMSETVCRRAGQFASSDGDLLLAGHWPDYQSYRPNGYCEPTIGTYTSTVLAVQPDLVRRLLAAPVDEPAVSEMLDLYAVHLRNSVAQWTDDRDAHQQEVAEKKRAAEAAQQEMERAREMLKDELARGKKAVKDLQTVAQFLSQIPGDALRGTAKRLTQNQAANAYESLIQSVEDASPYTVFEEEEDDNE